VEDMDLQMLLTDIANILSEGLAYTSRLEAVTGASGLPADPDHTPVVSQTYSTACAPTALGDLTMHQAGLSTAMPAGNVLDMSATTGPYTSSRGAVQPEISEHNLTVGQAGMQVPVVSRHDLTVGQAGMQVPVVTAMQRGTCEGSVYTPRRATPSYPPPGGQPTTTPIAVAMTSYPPPGGTPSTVMTSALIPPANNGWGNGSPARPDVNVSWAAPPLHNSTTNWGNLSQVNVNQTPPQYNPAYMNIAPHGTPPPLQWQNSPIPPPTTFGTPPQFPPVSHNTTNGLEQRRDLYRGTIYGGGPRAQMTQQHEYGGAQQPYRGIKLGNIDLTKFPGDDISKYFAFKQDFIAYIHSRENMPVEEKMAQLLSLTAGGPAGDLICNLTRDAEGYREALAQLDADFGNLDTQLTSALGGLDHLSQVDLNKPETVRAARIALRKVVAHLKLIPGTSGASHASSALNAVKLNHEARFSLNSFQTARGAMRLSFELFKQWAQSQLLLHREGPAAITSSVAASGDTPSTSTALPYKPKLPPKTVSIVGTGGLDESGDGCRDLECDASMTVMAVSRDEFGKYGKCINCSGDHGLAKCPGFRAMSDTQKMALIRKTRTCFRFMQGRHPRSDCPKPWTCRECNSDQHHTLLHAAFTSGLIPPSTSHALARGLH
jgi:hypothetical protein